MPSRSNGAAEPRSSRLRAAVRIAGLILLFLVCIGPHLAARAFTGSSRWPRRFLGAAAWIAGARVSVEGDPVRPHSLLLANHSSWLDILILAGATGTRFVSKAEIGRVPLIGWLADQNRTLYIERARRGEAHGQVRRIADALRDPEPLTIFPEGTTGSGRPLLPFRSTLLEAVAPPPPETGVRPVAVDYHEGVAAIAWTGGEPGLDNALRVLGLPGSRRVTVRLLAPLDAGPDRKALAARASEVIAAALSSVGTPEPLRPAIR